MSVRPKINFFSPLPPLRTGIAEHSARLLPDLTEIADVTVWTDQDHWVAIDGVEVVRFDSGTNPARFHAADINFYNLGNNYEFHGRIYELARRTPGVVILSDPNMSHFFLSLSDSPGGRLRYLDLVSRHYGLAGAEQARQMFAGNIRPEKLVLRYPMTEAALEGAVGVVVHNMSLRQELMASSGLPVFHIPLSHSERRLNSNESTAPPYRLITFGYLGPNRRLDMIMQALISFPRHDLFRWDIYGLSQKGREEILLERLRFRGRIMTHGFVEESVLDQALSEAHLAINLRNPTMGEASSSQLRIWEHALPALVSRVGWYAEQPADTLFFVDPENEVESITQHLAEFLRNPASFRAAGKRGQEYLYRVHNTRQYARALVEVAAQGSAMLSKRG